MHSTPSSQPGAPLDEALSLVRTIAPPTPIEPLKIDEAGPILLKREDRGPNATFKWRGAIAALSAYRAQGAESVVTASTGNHGAAVAWASKRLDMVAHVVVPSDAVGRKCDLIASHGARLHKVGADLDDASAYALQLAADEDVPYFEDGGSAAQLAGAATVGVELAAIEDLAAVFVPVACGALAAGIALAFEASERTVRIVGVQSTHYSRMTARFHGRPYVRTGKATFADGLADDRIVEPAFTTCMDRLDDLMMVDEEQLRAAVYLLWTSAGIRVEGAGAAALAGWIASRPKPSAGRVVAIISGGNLDPRDARSILSEDATLS